MKKLKTLLSALLVFCGLALLNPVQANAAWQQSDSGWWYTEGNSWSTGWRLIDGNWYYFYPSGYMAQDSIIDGYYVNENGAWTTFPEGIRQAEQKVKQYLENSGGYVAEHIEYDHTQDNKYVIHCYDVVIQGNGFGHTATSGWYYVDKTSGAITSMY
ncbi:hypothetical protein UT300005_19660 [Clostridium sp. CTA-5]